MINVGNNFGKLNLCPLRCIALDTQEHLFECNQLINDIIISQDFNYSDIFSENQKKFIYAVDLADKLIRKREKILTR